MAPLEFLSESVDEEEGIVNGDADADERDDVGRVDRHVGHVGQPDRHANGGSHGANANPDGKQGGDKRAEHDAKNEDGEGAGDQFSFDEVVFDAVVKRPVDRDTVGHPILELAVQVHGVMEVVDDGFRFLPVGGKGDLVDGVSAGVIGGDHVVPVHVVDLPRVLDAHL